MSLSEWFNRNFLAAADARERAMLTPPPKPRLVSVSSAPSREAFAVWRDDPVTQFVFLAYRNQQAECRDAWNDLSWNGGMADEARLNELRARADTYAALEDSDYEDFCAAVGVEPEAKPNAA